MRQPSDQPDDWTIQRERIIGMGESSAHKSYYPLLQQRIAELERFRALFDETNDMVMIIRASDHKYLDANRACSEQLEYESSDLLAREVGVVIAPSEQKQFRKILDYARSSGRQERFETVMITSAGREFPTEVSIRMVRLDDDEYGIIVARDIRERKAYESALVTAHKKLNLINFLTRNDIKTQVFIVRAYLDVLRQNVSTPDTASTLEKLKDATIEIQRQIELAENYRDMGAQNPRWQNFNEVFLYALSHLPPLTITRKNSIKGLEIHADPLLEKGLLHLLDYLQKQGDVNSEIILDQVETNTGLKIILEKTDREILRDEKNHIFGWEKTKGSTQDLFIVREILAITSILIKETGKSDTLRFELVIPSEGYRLR
jgi:PAS domain S-box-containing protein